MPQGEIFGDIDVITLSGFQPGAGARQLKSGDLIGGSYRLKSLIGKGGMGYVFCAEHTMIPQHYALKMLAPELLNDVTRHRFQIEGRAIANLDHPNIVKVYNMGLDGDNCPFYVMDLLHGQALSECTAGGALSLADSLNIINQMAQGLGYAHSKGIVHRDVKPSNVILLTDKNDQIVVKIVDFGIAKLLPSAAHSNQSQTATGEIFGSPLYMSPEQCMGDQVDARSDIYSLGCTLFEMLTGEPPFRGASALETVMMHQEAPVPPVGEPRIDQLIARMMAKKPEARYQSMQQVIHDVERVQLGKAIGKGYDYDFLEDPQEQSENPEADHEAELLANKKKRLQITAAVVGGLAGLVAASAAAAYFLQGVAPTTFAAPNTNGRRMLALIPVKPVQKPESNFKPKIDGSNGFVFDAIEVLKETTEGTAAGAAANSPPTISAALAKWPPIIAQPFVTGGGIKMLRFSFPPESIGQVVASRDDWYAARGQVVVTADSQLEFNIGGKASPVIVENPKIFDKLDPHAFAVLNLLARKNETLSSSFRGVQPESLGFLEILKKAKNWTLLNAISLKYFQINLAQMEALNKLEHLDRLELLSTNYDPELLAKQPFWARLQYAIFNKQDDIGPLIERLAHCKNFNRLLLIDGDLKPVVLAPLKHSKTLATLAFMITKQKGEFYGQAREAAPISGADIVALATHIPNLKKLRISGMALSTAEINALAASSIDSIYLSVKLYPKVEQIRCKVSAPKVKFVSESFDT